MTDREDRALQRRLIAGEEGAFDAVFRTWYAPLVRAADAMLRDRAVAEDVVQDVMLELWRRHAQLDPASTPQGYLFQSMRNRSLNHLRHLQVRRRAAPHLGVDDARPAPAASRVVASELQVAIDAAIAELPPRCREVFELSRRRGLRYAEIADLLGISVKAVEAQMGRALKTMRERLGPWLPGGDEPERRER